MRIDELGCLIMENEGPPGCLGDSAAESGRLVVLDPEAKIDLKQFIKPDGFWRHPNVPFDWGPADFSSDQMAFLLMAAYLKDRLLFNYIVNHIHQMTKFKTPDVRCIQFEAWNMLGLSQVAQMFINQIPWRWSDDQSRTGIWKYWRFTSSKDSTISYVTVFVAMVFLKRVGVTWPARFFNREEYLAKTKSYYANQPNSDWFVQLFANAET